MPNTTSLNNIIKYTTQTVSLAILPVITPQRLTRAAPSPRCYI